MASAYWKFILARSRDLSNIGELTQARDRQLSMVLNRSGSLSFSIPMNDELGAQIWPIESAIKAYRFGSTGAQLVWSGYVNTIDEDVANERMTVNCVGWLDRLAKRILHRDKAYATIDDGAIVQDLLADVNGNITTGEHASGTTSAQIPGDNYTARWPAGSSPNTPTWIKWGGLLPNEGTGGATAYIAQTRSQNYARFQTNIQQAIQALTDIENGCDFDIDPTARTLNVYRKKRRVLDTVVFGFRFGPENVAQFNRQIDGSALANYGLATGAASIAPGFYHDQASQDIYGPVQEVYALSDVTRAEILGAYANAEIVLKRVPRQIYTITPFRWTDENSVPEPFVNYRLGDQVRFVARSGTRVSINQQVRVFGIQVSIDAESNESLGQLQIYPGG